MYLSNKFILVVRIGSRSFPQIKKTIYAIIIIKNMIYLVMRHTKKLFIALKCHVDIIHIEILTEIIFAEFEIFSPNTV